MSASAEMLLASPGDLFTGGGNPRSDLALDKDGLVDSVREHGVLLPPTSPRATGWRVYSPSSPPGSWAEVSVSPPGLRLAERMWKRSFPLGVGQRQRQCHHRKDWPSFPEENEGAVLRLCIGLWLQAHLRCRRHKLGLSR